MSNDLEKSRKRQCPFSKVYLSNPFYYQKKYNLVDVFQKLDAFHERNAQPKFIRALLHCGTFLRLCNFCKCEFSDLLDHQIFHCFATASYREKLNAYLKLYNLPTHLRPSSTTDYFNISRDNKLWRKSFIQSLYDVDF